MHLLELKADGELARTEFFKGNIPEYAILSHTWASESEEVSFRDLVDRTGKSKAGYDKIQFCGKQAARDKLRYFWVDTCCIDQSNKTELSEAINSMFSWYREATKCYVYLSDVSIRDNKLDHFSQSTWELAFRESRWFTRGWTLQELIAPASVEFFSLEGKRLGDKKSLERQIHEITGIAIQALQGSPLSNFDVAERLSWAAKRKTKRKEDEAYCLLGIFDIYMPFIYGEGEKALIRLNDEIYKSLRGKLAVCARPPHTLNKTLLAANSDRTDQKDRRHVDEERKCYQALRTSDYEKYMARNPDRVEKTCQWFLQHPKFHNWRDSMTASLLWVSADPGSGKSVLSKSLVENELLRSESRSTCYFFFKDDDVNQKSATKALCALLHQLFSQNNLLIKHAMPNFHREGQTLCDLFGKLWSILTNAAADPEAGEIVCVLDALDECEESGRFELIDTLNRFYRNIASDKGGKTKLKFLITSRPYFDIERRFSQLTRHLPTIRLEGEKESESISREIDFVIKARVQDVGSELGLDDSENLSLEKALLSVTHRTYLWLKLIFEVIRNQLKEKRLQRIIGTLPDTVDKAYGAILAKSTDMKRARKLLHIVVSAIRPLTLKEMNTALAIEESDRSYEELDLERETSFKTTVRKLCGLFVSIIDHKIYLVHQTAKEFLVAKKDAAGPGSWKYTLEPTKSELVLAKVCIFYLLFTVFDCDPLIIDNGASKDDMEATIKQYINKHDFLDYAAKHWPTHYQKAQAEVDTALLEFYFSICDTRSKRFMTWFQVYWSFRVQCPQSVTRLTLASYFGHHTAVKLLLESNAELESKDENFNGQTPLSLAAEHGHEAVVNLLLAKGAELDSRSNIGRTPLSWAAAGGHEAVVKLLLENGAELNAVDDNKRTCLRWAARYGHEAVVNLVLEKGAELDSREKDGGTPLLWAAANGCNAVVKLLLERGAEVNPRSNCGRTPLYLAADSGHEAVVELLLERGAELESRDTAWGQTSLSRAARKGQEAVVKLLLEKGANPNSKDNDGGTPLSWASRNSHEPVLKLLLAKEGIDVDSKDSHGRTPLWWAAMRGNGAVVRQLLATECIKLDSEDNSGWTPLSSAAREGHHDTVELLLEKYKLNGIAIRNEDVDIATPPASDIKGHISCDICTLNVPDVDAHYHCGTCSNGDYDICQNCIAKQEYCSDRSHKLVKRMFENGIYVEVRE